MFLNSKALFLLQLHPCCFEPPYFPLVDIKEELRLKDALKKKGGEVCEVKERRSDEEEMESGKICVG